MQTNRKFSSKEKSCDRKLKMSKMEYPTQREVPVSKQKGMGKKSIVAVFNMDNVNEKKNII
jgi:hypothetical protein